MDEAGILSLIREMAGEPPPGLIVPIGDDSALFHFSGGDVLLTTDSLYEGVHFRLDTFDLSDVGWKAFAAGVSDIAAMGGEPACALLSLAFGRAPTESEVRSLVGGALEMLSSCNCALIGGDVCRSTCGLALTVTVAGTPPAGGSVQRGGAGGGDIVGITGTVGDSAAGLFILESARDELRATYPGLVEAHLRPRPKVRAGGLLASAGAAAMEDVSDGLAADLCHVCDEGGLGCEIEERLLPISDDARSLAREVSADPVGWALAGGEDYELLFTAAPGIFEAAMGSLSEHGIPAAGIGVMLPAGDGCTLKRKSGEVLDLKGVGYDHFRPG